MSENNIKKPTINEDLLKELVDRTSRKSLLDNNQTLFAGEVKQITGGVDAGKVRETLKDDNVNILNSDIQQRLGEEQSAGKKWMNFAVQSSAEILGGSLEGVGYAGDVKGIVDIVDGDMNSFGNWLSDIGSSIKESSRENFPIFGAQDMGNLGFWLSNGVSVTSSLSLMIPATGIARGVGALGKAIGIAGKMGKTSKAYMSVFGNALASRHMENMMEASENWKYTLDYALSNGKSMDEAKLIASEAASKLYKYNYFLMAQDIVQFGLLARGPKINGEITSKRLAQALGKDPRIALGNMAYGTAVDMASEGIEEGLQYVFSEETRHSALNKAGLVKDSELGDRLSNYGKNSELWTSMLFGALGAGVMQGAGAALRKTDIPGIGGKGEREQLEARIQHAKDAAEDSAKAGVRLKAAIESKDDKDIRAAENDIEFNLAYNAAVMGNFDYFEATIDDLINTPEEEASSEGANFSKDYKVRLRKVKENGKVVADLFRKNSKKYEGSTVKTVTELQFKNINWNKAISLDKESLSRSVNEFARHGDLSAQGNSKFDAVVQKKSLEAAITIQESIEEQVESKRSKLKARETKEKLSLRLDKVNKSIAKLEEQERKDIESEKTNPNDINSAYNIASDVSSRVERDNDIIDGLENNGDDIIYSNSGIIIAEQELIKNNEALKLVTSKEVQAQVKKNEEDAIKNEEKENRQKEKDLAEELKKKDKEATEDSVNESSNRNQKNKKEKKEKKEKKAETTKEKPSTKDDSDDSDLSGLTEDQLSNIELMTDNEEDFIAVKKERKRRKNELESKNRKKTAKVDKNVSEQSDIVSIHSADSAPTPENQIREVKIDEDVFDPVAETGFALGWKSVTKLDEEDIEADASDPEMASLITNFFEDPDISLLDHSVEFFIDQEILEEAKNYKKSDILRTISEKLDKGEDITSVIGMLPVKAYILNKKGERVNTSGRDLEVPIHDITFEGWNKLPPEKSLIARSELTELKTYILENRGKSIVSPIVTQRGGVPNNSDTFTNAAEALNSSPEDLQLMVGSKALPGTSSGTYNNSKKEAVEELENLESATPGALYAAVKRANGKVFPARLWVSKLEDQEAELVHMLYSLTIRDSDSYRSILDNNQEVLGFMKNSNDTKVSSLLDFIDPNKTTVQQLLSMLVYEGPHTKKMGEGALYSIKGSVKVGNVRFSNEEFLSEDGKFKFKEALRNKMRQIPNDLIDNNEFKSYLTDNEILTANFHPGESNFIQPTVIFGDPKIQKEQSKQTQSSEVELTAETVTDKKGRTYTYFSDTKTKNGTVTTTYTFNRSDKSSSQRNQAVVKPEVALNDKGYKVTESYIPEGTKVNKVYETRVDETDPSKAGATVEFLTEEGDTFRAEVQIVQTQQSSEVDTFTKVEGKYTLEQKTIKGGTVNQTIKNNENGSEIIKVIKPDGSVKFFLTGNFEGAPGKMSGLATSQKEIDSVLSQLGIEARNFLGLEQPTQSSEVEVSGSKNTVSSNKVTEKANKEEMSLPEGVTKETIINKADESGTNLSLAEKLKNKSSVSDMKSRLKAKLGKPKSKVEDKKDQYKDEDYDDSSLSPFKVRDIKDKSKPLTQEEVSKVSKIVPNEVAIEMTEDYINLLSGGRAAVGLFTSGLIKLSAKAKSGDAYHEAFHAVFRTSLSESKQSELIEEAKKSFLSPMEDEIHLLQATHEISRESAIGLFYEEQLADEFALYAENPEGYRFSENSKKTKGFFARISEWIKSFLNKPKNYQSVFKNILDGNYRSNENVDAYISSGAVASIDNKTKKPC